ncbi:HpcH/HpaI aldolase family protein [Alsobacter sp. SYSU BS001988]|jgi:4-hydroxy-2-oxoheptanedioate aldolase
MPLNPSFASLSQRLGKGTGAGLITGWVGLPDPLVAGVVANEAFDAVVLDMQHGFVDIASAVQGVAQIALAGKPAVVRIPVGQFATASRVLDAGAAGVIAPMVNSAADARALVSFTKYPPLGERSWGPAIALNVCGLTLSEYLAQANGLTATIAMVETREALAALDDILAVDGIDGVLVGPSDLSIALANGASVNPMSAEVDDALRHVAERCRAHGKAACTFVTTGAKGKDVIAMGYDFLALGTDVMQLRAGAKAFIEACKG